MLVADQVPKLNVEATCKGSVAADKAMGLMLPQGFDKCMSDENSAQSRERSRRAIGLTDMAGVQTSRQIDQRGRISAIRSMNHVDAISALNNSPAT